MISVSLLLHHSFIVCIYRKILKNCEKAKEYFRKLCVPVASMVRPPPLPKILLSSGSHVNVGEWVEVEHCYSVGTCSDGRVAIVTKFESGMANVRYFLFAFMLKRY
jgi:hypothetical protein